MNAPASATRSPIQFGHQGRVVLITGGAQGIGAACARRFASEGARVVLADVADAPGQAQASELGGQYVHCDVGNRAQVNSTVAREMATRGSGSIVHRSSVNGVMAIPNIASYNVSKGGINQLTRVMALADHGIRVNAVAPGTIATELAAQAVLTSEAARTKILSRTPMKRLGQPKEIADVVAWLASDSASYVTGEIITVDGGRMALNHTVPV